MSSHERKSKSQNPHREDEDLEHLLELLNKPVPKQQAEAGSAGCKSSSRQHKPPEAVALEKFSHRYQHERQFSRHRLASKFTKVFTALVKERLCCTDWINKAPVDNISRMLLCLRILLRDSTFHKHFLDLGGIKSLSEYFEKATSWYLYGDGPAIVDILAQVTNILQKLCNTEEHRDWLVACSAHKSLVLLLHASDVMVLICSLNALIKLAESKKPRQAIGELNSIETLLRIVQDYDTMSRKLSAKLICQLCAEAPCRDLIKRSDGVPILLSQLHSDNVSLLCHVVWCLVQLASNPDVSSDIGQLGGIPLLLSLMHDRKLVSERADASDAGTPTPGLPSCKLDEEEIQEQQLNLKSACCAALTELVLSDTNAQHVVQANGIYAVGLLILPQPCSSHYPKAAENLQRNAFRALRLLFSMERNRRLFKLLFPADLYTMFIDVGHYNRDLAAYRPLVTKINSLPPEMIAQIQEKIMALNHNKVSTHHMGDYAVFELLGSGAFGSVYKVRQRNSNKSFLTESFMALKEISLQHAAFGKNAAEKETSVGELTNEINIIRRQLKHPNVVRYYRTFIENDKLYIVMELIEGAPLQEHFNSLKEKKAKFEEGRIWNIFIQMILALRYLHKEKGIVHRDLTPNNIMLGGNDKVTITDFGLAKQKHSDSSKMTSVVGTILYCCPEIVQNKPYGEKADIWALGCILYQMCTLTPPFFSSNMLTLATKIVTAEYDPIPEGTFTKRLVQTIRSCICADPDQRPDVLSLSCQMVDILLVQMDNLRIQQHSLERKLEREKERTKRHFFEATRNMQNYHRLFLASQERYDKLASLGGSGGAAALKDHLMIGDREMREKFGLACSPGEDPELMDRVCTSDEDFTSSESESRGSSAGSTKSRSCMYRQDSQYHSLPSHLQEALQRHQDMHQESPLALSQLNLDILTSAQGSRDSSASSGDPSPSANPGSVLELQLGSAQSRLLQPQQSLTASDLGHGRLSHNRNAAMLSISPNRLREISDPIVQMLHQLHKIIYITQLPPTLRPDPKRRMIDIYKRALFAQKSTSTNLKSEMKKLLQGSRDLIDLNLGQPETPKSASLAVLDQDPFCFNPDRPATSHYDPDHKEVGITYEKMQAMIESTLVDSGYYSVHSQDRERTPPFSPFNQEA